jgi:hypothetical protein
MDCLNAATSLAGGPAPGVPSGCVAEVGLEIAVMASVWMGCEDGCGGETRRNPAYQHKVYIGRVRFRRIRSGILHKACRNPFQAGSGGAVLWHIPLPAKGPGDLSDPGACTLELQ